LIVAGSLLLAPPAVAGAKASLGPCGPGADLVAFSDTLNKTTFGGTAVGGLSAIALRGGAHARALVDNQAATNARFYDLDLDAHGGFAPTVQGVTTLRRADGTPYTGTDFDGEGLVSLPDGSILASSETEPAIRHFSPDGVELGDLEVPDRFRVAPAGDATNNLTLEGLGLSPDGHDLWAAMEGSLAPDGTTADGRARLRFLHYERSGDGFALVGQVAYLADPLLGVSEVQVVDGGELLVLERGFQAGVGNTVRVYRASVAGAADVTALTSLARPDVAFVPKALLVDVGQCPSAGATNPGTQQNPLLDNIEGMAMGHGAGGGRRELFLVSDDNFGAGQVTRVYELAAELHG
jgi:hypothetical protein